MSLSPLLSAPPHIQLHALAGLFALLLGPVALHGRKPGAAHRLAGFAWIAAMVTLAVSSFWIGRFGVIGPFSPIHLLSLLVLASLALALRHIRHGRVARHAEVMRSLYWNGLLIAGTLNFLPGRTVNRVFFGGEDALGWAVIALAGGLLALRALWLRARPQELA